MSENCWVLEGVDAENRRRAVEEAERRGVPLGDYLTEIVARTALADRIAPAAAAPEQEALEAASPRGNSPDRYLVEALERRLGLAVEALDGSVCGLAARVDEAEASAVAAADQLNQRLQDAGDHLAALHQRLASAEEQAEAASASTAQLAAGLDEARAAADTASAQADAAVGHLLQELRTVSEAVEVRLQESATETRARVQAAFADATEYMNTLAGRATDCEQLALQSAEQLRTQIADVEDGAQTAIEATAETLRQAGAALAAEFAHATRETRSALENVHHDLSVEIADLREQQASGAARLEQLDAASTTLMSDVTAMRQTMDARAAQGEEAVRAVLARAQAEWDARHDALRADSERIEARAFAVLEKVANDRAAGDDAALHRELADVRDQASGALARLTLLDRAIGSRDLIAAGEAGAAPLSGRLTQIEAALAVQGAPSIVDRSFDERLLRLEAAHESEETAHALAALRGQVGAVAAQLDAQQIEGAQLLDDLRAQVGEAADRAQGAVQAANRMSAQTSEAEERLHKLELVVVDLRQETPPSEGGAAEAVQSIERRVAEFEQRQEVAVEQLRADIARLIDENARRLEALDQPVPTDIATEFDGLRRRIEERILDVEQRSVRALEQAADTMAVLEQRFSDSPEAMLRSA